MSTWCLRVEATIGNFVCYSPRMSVTITTSTLMQNLSRISTCTAWLDAIIGGDLGKFPV
jgi:hypothetical protein